MWGKEITRDMRILAIIFVISLIITIATVGCSFGADNEMLSSEYAEQIVNPDRSLFYGETIRIAVQYPFFIQPFVFRYMEANPGVRIEVIRHATGEFEPDADWDQVRMEVGTQLMAGSAPTLIDFYLADPFDPRQAVFFDDLYKLMDADPDFNEEDWFMNVFHAFEIDNRLYHFPLNFWHGPVLANRGIEGLSEAMVAYNDGITLSELMQLSSYFTERYPQYYLEQHFSSRWIMQLMSEQFIDMEVGSVDFGEEFIDLIIYADSITCSNINSVWWTLGGNAVYNSLQDQMMSERYLFHLDTIFWFWYWLDFYEDIHSFASMTALTNDRGELLIHSPNNFLLNANATTIEKAIAWDFLMFIMQPENFSHDSFPPWDLQPPNRSLFNRVIHENMYHFLNHGDPIFSWFPGTYYEATEGIITRMTSFFEMPMQVTSAYPRIIDNIIEENMRLFHEGLLSAEQTAQNLQNQITLVLMEMER